MLAFFLGFVTCYAMFVTGYLVLLTKQNQRLSSRNYHPTNGGWN
jgi:hypothetical protein